MGRESLYIYIHIYPYIFAPSFICTFSLSVPSSVALCICALLFIHLQSHTRNPHSNNQAASPVKTSISDLDDAGHFFGIITSGCVYPSLINPIRYHRMICVKLDVLSLNYHLFPYVSILETTHQYHRHSNIHSFLFSILLTSFLSYSAGVFQPFACFFMTWLPVFLFL